jgi:hypothetical protein
MSMRKELALAALFIGAVALAGCAYQTPGPTGTELDFSHVLWQNIGNNWPGVAAMAVIMAASFVSVAYMIGSLLNNQNIIGWAKSEFMQVLASALIIGGVFWLVSMVTALSASAAGYTGINCASTSLMEDPIASGEIARAPCHINVAQQYIEIMYENVFHESKDILRAASLLAVAANFNITLEMLVPPWLSLTIVPYGPLNMVFETLALAFDMLVKIMLLQKFQLYFMSFTWRALFPMLLVMGVILRTFFFSRKLGGLLIALAIGIYVAYPLSYALAYYVLGGTSAGTYVVKIDSRAMDAADLNMVDLQGSNIDTVGERIDKLEGKSLMGDVLSVGGVGLGSVGPVIVAGPIGGPGALALGSPTINNWVTGDNGILESVSILLVYSTFVPLLALISTISFVKVLSPMLGGDVDIAGITHLL